MRLFESFHGRAPSLFLKAAEIKPGTQESEQKRFKQLAMLLETPGVTGKYGEVVDCHQTAEIDWRLLEIIRGGTGFPTPCASGWCASAENWTRRNYQNEPTAEREYDDFVGEVQPSAPEAEDAHHHSGYWVAAKRLTDMQFRHVAAVSSGAARFTLCEDLLRSSMHSVPPGAWISAERNFESRHEMASCAH